ncbi:MAG: hypothetical protein ACJ743_09965 [Gaiellaceae bacterium]
MDERWIPTLSIREVGDRCRLSLGGHVHGEGLTLQEAADDLVRRLLAQAMSLRSEAGFRVSPEGPGVDLRWFEFLYELGALAARGEDIRGRVFDQAA